MVIRLEGDDGPLCTECGPLSTHVGCAHISMARLLWLAGRHPDHVATSSAKDAASASKSDLSFTSRRPCVSHTRWYRSGTSLYEQTPPPSQACIPLVVDETECEFAEHPSKFIGKEMDRLKRGGKLMKYPHQRCVRSDIDRIGGMAISVMIAYASLVTRRAAESQQGLPNIQCMDAQTPGRRPSNARQARGQGLSTASIFIQPVRHDNAGLQWALIAMIPRRRMIVVYDPNGTFEGISELLEVSRLSGGT